MGKELIKLRAACSVHQVTDFSRFISFCVQKNPFTMLAFHEITIHKDKRISVSHLRQLKLNAFAHNLRTCFRTATISSKTHCVGRMLVKKQF